jgi:hypothetical protein
MNTSPVLILLEGENVVLLVAAGAINHSFCIEPIDCGNDYESILFMAIHKWFKRTC